VSREQKGRETLTMEEACTPTPMSEGRVDVGGKIPTSIAVLTQF
jgi:hypothetical protein